MENEKKNSDSANVRLRSENDRIAAERDRYVKLADSIDCSSDLILFSIRR